MVRIGLLLLCMMVAAGCSTTRKVVVNHGYPGATAPPVGFETRPAQRAEIETPVRFP